MKRDLGTSAGFLAIFAILLHTAFPTATETGSSQSSQEKAASAAQKAKGASDSDAVPPREGPWLATRAFFNDNKLPLPSTAEATDALLDGLTSGSQAGNQPLSGARVGKLREIFGLPIGRETFCVVATVADPAHTRLSLFFDGQVDAIRHAAEQQGWNFAQQWLPWLDPFTGSDDDIAKRRTERRLERDQEELPGILVFGQGPQTLLIFLVPEAPTSGVAGDSFYAALNLASVLSQPSNQVQSQPPKQGQQAQKEIGLLAPSFSGSFRSMSEMIRRWSGTSPPQQAKIHDTVFGGSISSRRAAQTFSQETQLSFRSGIVSSEDYKPVFEKQILDRYRLKREDVAYLVEEESFYGNSMESELKGDTSEAKENPIRLYRFPRDISHLRNAYQQAAGSSKRSNDPNALPAIDFTLKDPARGEDSIPVFSDTATPLSQSAVVNSILAELKRTNTRLVYITSTNTLDEIFLTQLVRRQCPDTRVIIGGDADVLFVPAAVQDPLTGTLFLTTYPMFIQGDQWLGGDGGTYRLPTANLQGLSNVGEILLGQLTHNRTTLQGYGQLQTNPSGDFPGLWLVTLTRFGFSPVDWFEARPQSEQKPWFAPSPVAAPGGGSDATTLEDAFRLPDPPLGWYVTSIGISFAIFVGAFFLLRSNFQPGYARPLWLALSDSEETRGPALFGVCMLLSSMEWILFVPAFHLASQGWNAAAGITVALTAVGFLTPLAAAALVFWKTAQRRGIDTLKLPGPSVGFAAFYVVLYGLILIMWARSCGGLGAAATPHDLVFRLRALDLYSGASPSFPLLLLVSMFALGFSIYFYRYTQSGMARPRLALTRSTELSLAQDYANEIEQYIGAPMKLPGRLLLRRMTACVLVMGVCLLMLRGRLHPFETWWPYNCLLYTAVAIISLALAEGCYDLILLWRDLQRLLELIDFFPLRTAFGRVARPWPQRAAWTFWRPISEQTLSSQMLRALQNRCHCAEQWGGPTRARADLDTVRALTERRFADGKVTLETRLAARQEFHGQIASKAAAMLDDILYWDAAALGDPGAEDDDSQSPFLRFARNTSDFVALQFSCYFIYAARQVQITAWGVSVVLLMLIVVLNSYSAQSPLVVGRFVAVAFVAAGFVIGWVFAGMERNAILSRISHTAPGALSGQFWMQLLVMGLLPLVGVLAHLYPTAATFLSSWVVPSVQALH